MSAYSGPQGKGAARKRQDEKRRQAKMRVEARQAQDRLACISGKQIILSKEDAKKHLAAAKAAKKQGYVWRNECRWYHCNLCDYYHLTSQPLKEKEEKA